MRLKRWFTLLICGGICATLLAVAGGLYNPYGSCLKGERVAKEYYLYSPSSQAKILSSPTFAECFFLTGETSAFRFSTEKEAAFYAEALLREKKAQVVCEEHLAGARSIYAYVSGGAGGILLFGARVNLHLVIKGAEVQVGTPIIFGGY